MKITKTKLKQIIKEELAKVLNEETPEDAARREMERQFQGYGDDEPAPAKTPAAKPATKPAAKPKPKLKPAGPAKETPLTRIPQGSKFSNFKIKQGVAYITYTTPDGVSAIGTATKFSNPVHARRTAETEAAEKLRAKLAKRN